MLAISLDEGKPVGVLLGTASITEQLPDIVLINKKDTGSKIVYDNNPYSLLEKTFTVYEKVKNNPKRCDASG